MTQNNFFELRYRAMIQERDFSDDGAGGVSKFEWKDKFLIWVSIDPISAGEVFEYDIRRKNLITHIVKSRYREDITNEMRLIYESRTFIIKNILLPLDKRNFLTILVEEAF